MIFNISYFVDLQPFAKKLQKRPKKRFNKQMIVLQI